MRLANQTIAHYKWIVLIVENDFQGTHLANRFEKERVLIQK